VLVVTKLDRLARSVADLCAIVEEIERKGASLRGDAYWAAHRERHWLRRAVRARDHLERQREGVQRAKRVGKYKGRAPTARAKASDIVRLARASRWSLVFRAGRSLHWLVSNEEMTRPKRFEPTTPKFVVSNPSSPLHGRHFLEKGLAFGSKVSMCVHARAAAESAAGDPAPEIVSIRGLRQ
jgi:hypothetical protein